MSVMQIPHEIRSVDSGESLDIILWMHKRLPKRMYKLYLKGDNCWMILDSFVFSSAFFFK